MTKKIFRACFTVAAAVLLASMLIIFGILYDYFAGVQDRQLDAQLDLAASDVEVGGIKYFDGLKKGGCRFTWVRADGAVIRDTEVSEGEMENHAEREEIKRAFAVGAGRSKRYSGTLLEETSYSAKRLADGTVLRAAVTRNSLVMILLGMVQPMIVVLVIAAAIAALLARSMARRIAAPLNEFDLENPLSNDVYDELSPLVHHMDRQNRQISRQLAELRHDKEELAAITENLNEGLAVLDEKGTVVSINPAARRIFAADGDCVGRPFLAVDRGIDITRLIDEATESGRAEARIERGGRVYSLRAGKIGAPHGEENVVILLFDITEMVYAEKNRREFTANVSHELKTPLQSIMGSAELIENGLVKKEDMPVFIRRIRGESERLLNLIEDIIRLSQMDEENEKPPLEEVDLFEIANEVADELRGNAEKRDVSVAVVGERTQLRSVGRLVREIVYNLFDNAVKYNRDGGDIKVKVYRADKNAVFEIADTGVGIPADAQSRVFERFFRVDKSRSREIGGTGLGLSIVKHAAESLGARIELESEVGKGTRIRIEFPVN